MKNLIIKILLLILLIGCGNKKIPDIRPFDILNLKDQEPNDQINNAVEVSAQGPIIGFFNNKKNVGDKDYYKVFFQFKGISYKLIQTAVPGIDSKITFLSPSKKRLLYIDNGKRGEAEKLWQYYPDGEYMIMLIESKTGYNEKVPYVVEFYPGENNDINEIEPNNSNDEASIIKIGDEKKGLISPKSDLDYYKINFDKDSVYDFSIKVKTFSDLDLNFTIYNLDDDTFKIINNNGWGQDEYFPFLSSDKGNYIIKVGGNINSNDRKNPIYTIKLEEILSNVDGEETHYEREFNDDSKSATVLIDGAVNQGIFYPRDDIDWYKYDIIRRAKSVNISLSSIKGIEPKIEIYNSKLELLETYDYTAIGNNGELIFDNVKKGSYYIKLSSREDSQQVYKLYLNVRY